MDYNKMKKTTPFNGIKTQWLCIILGILWSLNSTAQNIGHGNIPDSLLKLSYQELRDIYYPFIDKKDTINATLYINAHIKKAKLEKNIKEQASGYFNISANSNIDIGLRYSDSIIQLTKNKKENKYLSYGYFKKGSIQFNIGNYKDALDNFSIALSWTDTAHVKQIWDIKSGISALKHRAGQHREAFKISQNILKSIRSQQDYKSKFYEDYSSTLFSLSLDYLYLDKVREAEKYINIAIYESVNIGDSVNYYQYYSTLGEIKYRSGNYPKAIEIFSECIPKIEDYSLANAYTFRGKSYWDLGDKEKAILDYEKADSILWTLQDYSPEILEVYTTLNKHYGAEGNYQKQLTYINKLIHVDSILDADALYLSKEIKDQYDIPLLIAERQEIIDTLENKNANYSKWLYGLVIALGTSLVFGIYYYRKRLGYKKKFDALIKEQHAEKQESKHKITKATDLNIDPEVVAAILEKLSQFEEEQRYLKSNLSLQNLSKLLDTNSNYLSKIINASRQKNFSSYISDLRIVYVLEELKTNTNLRKYTIKAIATEVGFGNPESFTKAFKAKTGIYPSYYIKRLNKGS